MRDSTLKTGKELPLHSRRSRTSCVGWSFVATLALGLASAGPLRADETPLDLRGAWYVLVHYRDANARDSEFDYWEDKIWVFEERGSRMQWTEYGVVVFRDERGRFVSLASGREVKTEGAWSPDAAQLREIERGLEVDSRGGRAKTLRGSAARGYRSSGSMQTDSVSVIGYSETWEILQLAGLPILRRSDVMDSGRSESLDGNTEYRTVKIDRGVSTLEGDFSRDGVQKGSFKMVRTGPVSLATPERSH